ncbi:metallophosphoesterase [Polaromonas sp. JS666]|uniref:metallophosphoesterase n=1 Tax=Polaromonas sp. (strain JS666 / ATCC BAA-500) TaxID=296591 RepID=UPI0012ECD2DF|nr:metallophosphoesterase [Polaromonas sp. JS666]
MKLRIAVLSDLHATGHAENNPSSSYMRAHPRAEDPDLFSDLKETIARECLTVDLLVCPGDICDKGDQIGFT